MKNDSKYFAILSEINYEGNKQKSILELKAHESNRCVPIFETDKIAKLFMGNYLGKFEIQTLNSLNIKSNEINNQNRGYYFIDLGIEGIKSYKEGKLTTAESWKSYLK